jgi:hypothetical protein
MDVIFDWKLSNMIYNGLITLRLYGFPLAEIGVVSRMVPVTQLEEMVLAEGPLADSEIAQRLKEAMDTLKDSSGAIIDFMFLVPRHPPIRLEPNFVRFVSYPLPFTSFP